MTIPIKTTPKRADGFSLLEVVITLTILVSIIFSISTLLRNSFEIKIGLSEKNRVTHRINRAMQKITHDLEHAFLLHPKWHANRTENMRRTIFTIKKQSNGDRLAMTYMGHQASLRNSPESDLSYVVYELRESEKFPGRRDLYRGELLRIPSRDYRFREDPPMRLFVANVARFQVAAWTGDDWSKNSWDSSSSDTENLLPHLVLIEVSAWGEDPSEDGGDYDSGEAGLVHASSVTHLPYALDSKELKTRNSSFNWKL